MAIANTNQPQYTKVTVLFKFQPTVKIKKASKRAALYSIGFSTQLQCCYGLLTKHEEICSNCMSLLYFLARQQYLNALQRLKKTKYYSIQHKSVVFRLHFHTSHLLYLCECSKQCCNSVSSYDLCECIAKHVCTRTNFKTRRAIIQISTSGKTLTEIFSQFL